eukprot:280406_1
MSLILRLIYLLHLCIAAPFDNNVINIGEYPKDFDCNMRQLALQFAQNIQPFLSSNQLTDIANALNGSPEARDCNITLTNLSFKPNDNIKNVNKPITNDYDITYFIDITNGNDFSNDGTINKPFQTIETALHILRSKYNHSHKKRIILRAGKYYLTQTIIFNYIDSNLLITNYKNENVEISGANPLQCDSNGWKIYKKSNDGLNYYQCHLVNITSNKQITGIRINTKRAIRCRYPNANPETDGFASNLKALSWIPPIYPNPKPDIDINPTNYPVRTQAGENWFYYFNLGINGTSCSTFSPYAGYFCASNPEGGGGATYKVPSGLRYNQTILPNSPYINATYGVIQAWRPAYWLSWMFEIGEDFGMNYFKFKRGGFQGSRGNNIGEEFYIENVFEELDFPNEWFYNSSEQIIYFRNNETNKDPSNILFEYTNLKILFNFTGNISHIIDNITISGLIFSDTELTYLDIHGMPSGGDITFSRTGAIYMEYCSNFKIINNYFRGLDGNGISINKYNRNHMISQNEAVWIGGSFFVLWGDSDPIKFENIYPETSMGWDGTTGSQPRFINISHNLIHEVGIWSKQSTMYFQAKSCSNIIAYNIFYNGCRSGINFNDGFGGNNTIYKNLLFNLMRESLDNGPFNSWDRQVYVTKVRNGSESVIKANDNMDRNFIIGNYNAQEGFDTDDGACYYNITNNFLVYGQVGLKSDYGGHDIYHYNNIFAYLSQQCFWINIAFDGQQSGFNDIFVNNTCILNINQPNILNYGGFSCDKINQDRWPILGSNKIYQLNNNVSNVGLCGLSETEFQMKYNTDLNTIIYGQPNNTDIIQQAKYMLFD